MIRLKILQWYAFREIATSFVFSFAVFLVMGLVVGFLPLLQRGVEAGLKLTLILFQVLISALPGTLVTVLPLSITIGVLLGLGRMAADNEMAAIKSAGISVTRLLPAVLALGSIGCGISLACTLVLIPRGISEGRRLMQEAATTRADAGIQERTFFDGLKDLIIYVDRMDTQSGVLHGVFLRDSSAPDEVRTVVAEKGRVVPDTEGQALILDLRNGTILRENKAGDSTGNLAFERHTFRFMLARAADAGRPSFEELPIQGIQERVREFATLEASAPLEDKPFYHRARLFARILITQRFTHPLACLALALAAFPLGVVNLGKSRLNNVSLGLVIIFIYYTLTLSTERVARSGLAPPEVILPVPTFLFVWAGLYVSRLVAWERPITLPGLSLLRWRRRR